MAINSKVACVVMMISLMVAAAPHAEAAITCAAVLGRVSPCLNYLRSGGAPPVSCCDAVKSLYFGASTPDLQAICNCVKALVPSAGVNPVFLNNIPAKCSVNIPYRYSPSIDCSKVHS